jgi:lipoprotein-anchoring transpeptidase ErfK/SrfK
VTLLRVLVAVLLAPVAASPPLDRGARETLRVQVALDRAGFSVGEIDGRDGANTRRALAAYEQNGGRRDALTSEDPLTSYVVSDADAAGPFVPDIPDDMMAEARLPSLGYRDVVEMLAERFHASPGLLRRLNPRVRFRPGDRLVVPNVADVLRPVAPPPGSNATRDAASTRVTVTRRTSSLTVRDASGRLLFYAPVTTGSRHDPLPIGTWKVTGVQHDPVFHYNPDLFWDADPAHAKATIAAGPNNPVGVVWIDIDKPHYGLHGTPEPSEVGHAASHGCVRLTNWDAETVASLVDKGTPVVFER